MAGMNAILGMSSIDSTILVGSFRIYYKIQQIALFRLVAFVFLIAFWFTMSPNVLNLVWWTFPIAEVLTAVFAVVFLKRVSRRKIDPL